MAVSDLETVTIVLTVNSGTGPVSFTMWVTTETTGNTGDPVPASNYATHIVGIL